jgi:hypothetical protein
MKTLISTLFFLFLSPFAIAENPPEQFICQGLAGNFPGTCLLQGQSLMTSNWIDCFSWTQYGPPNDLSGPDRACEQRVQSLNDSIQQNGLCLCEQQGDGGAQLRKWTAGSFSFDMIQQFPRVEPADETPPMLSAKAFGLCSEALKNAEQAGVCPR